MNSLTRRRFLRDASTATAAAMLPPFFLQASSKSGSRFPIVGSGVHTYECVHDWLVPPDGLVWGDTHGLAQDAQGHIYVAHTRSEEHTSELQSRLHLVCRLLLEKKKKLTNSHRLHTTATTL